ncbi:MAG: catalase [Lachnospiraceae bacterium]|nr:catalase [Lachnospiraceae bacterium]
MDIRQLAYNFKGHFMTITKHRHEVMKNCFKSGIFIQGLLHDLSKYSPTEFFVGVMHFQGDRSPNEGEREDYGYSKAWMHHKGRNKHHFEYWTDYDPQTKKMSPVRMPKKYVIEMFCDRVAASKVYLGENYNDSEPLNYYLKGKSRRLIHKQTADEIENLLTMLEEQGEEATFRHIRIARFFGKQL